MYEHLNIQKAAYADDDVYLDENGKHIIFRFVRGQIRPIHVDSTDYVDWLKEQGVPVDNTSQEAMRQAEELLQTLDKIREASGPETAAKYEKQIIEYYKNYHEQALKAGYEQAATKRATEKGQTYEQYQEELKTKYKENKDNEISSSKDREGEWDAFVSSFTDDFMKQLGDPQKGTTQWGIANGFDLALMIAIEKAKKGTPPSQVNLTEILKEEIKTRDGVSRHFGARYDPKEGGLEYNKAIVSVMNGVDIIQYNLDNDSDFGKRLDEAFDRMYLRMFNDFDKPNQRKLAPMAGNVVPNTGENVPDELPESFSQQEASRLFGLYSSTGGAKLPTAHKVMIHSLGRLWEQIPPERRAEVYARMTNDKEGLHSIHKRYFVRAFQDTKDGALEVNPARRVEESLRSAMAVSESTNVSEIYRAMKEIVTNMAELDGYYTVQNNKNATLRDVTSLWNDSPVLAGRAKSKGEGPNLLQFFNSEEGMKRSTLPNSTLRIVHGGRRPPKLTATQEVENGTSDPPEIPPTAVPNKEEPETTQKAKTWERTGRVLKDPDTGWKAEMTPSKNLSGLRTVKIKVTNAEGISTELPDEIVSEGMKPDELLDKVISEAKNFMARAGKPTTSQPETQTPKEQTKESKTTPKQSKTLPNSAPPKVSDGKLFVDLMGNLKSSGINPSKLTSTSYQITTSKGKIILTLDDEGKMKAKVLGGEEFTVKSPTDLDKYIKEKPTITHEDTVNKMIKETLLGIPDSDMEFITDTLTKIKDLGLLVIPQRSVKRVVIDPGNGGTKLYLTRNGDNDPILHVIKPDGGFRGVDYKSLLEEAKKLL